MVKNTKDNRKKIAALALLGLSAVGLVGLSVAYFSDVINLENKNATMGTLDLVLGNASYVKHVDAKGKTVDDATAYNNVNPGDCIEANLDIENLGNKSAYVRIVANAVVAPRTGLELPVDENGKLSEITFDFGTSTTAFNVKSYELNEDGEIEVTYISDPFIINGTGDYKETETEGTDGYAQPIKICLEKTAKNAYQGISILGNIRIEGIQYRNNETGFGDGTGLFVLEENWGYKYAGQVPVQP